MARLPKKFGSKEEERFFRALEKQEIPFYYQYAIYGGRRVRGGVVVDFVLAMFWQPVEIFGEHWHSGALGAEDRLTLAKERQFFKREPVIIWARELPDQAAADLIVKQRFM